MMIDALKTFLRELRDAPELREAAWLGLREVREQRHLVSAQDGHILDVTRDESRGVMVEVFARGQPGYAATTTITSAGLRAAAERALAQARAAERFALVRFRDDGGVPAVRPSSVGGWTSAAGEARPLSAGGEASSESAEIAAADLAARAVELTARMKLSPHIVQTMAGFDVIQSTMRLVSSSGAELEQTWRGHVLQLEATAHRDGLTQKRSDGDTLQNALDRLHVGSLSARAERVATQALELLDAEECPTGTMDLVLMPSQMTLQIHESIGHPLELDRILGDERNYAGWSFVRLADIGTLQYGSPVLNVTFDPTVNQEMASYGFDDGGNPAQREYLIRDGLLVRALGGLESQERAGVPGVANFRASSWNRPPVDRMANINVEPGTSSFEEIVGAVERGILMDTNRSWSIDDYRNKFQFGCEYGRLIEHGKLTRTVRNPNYRGVTTPFWSALRKVGNASTLETHGAATCGKAEPNQLIRVGHRSPVCLFADVEVFGGAV